VKTLEEALKRNAVLEQEITFLKEELTHLKRMVFGSKKERFIAVDSDQQSLFDGEVETIEADTQTISYKREKGKRGKAKRLLLPAHLPREEESLEPQDLSEDSVKIGEKVTEVLEYTPGKLYVHKIVRPVYKQDNEIKVAELPSQVIPGGNAGASLLSYLLVSKFIDHLPFYRQVQIFKRDGGMKIPESTITGWYRKTCELLEPLYDEMLSRIRGSDYIQADESPIPVLSKDKPGSTHKGYQWVYHMPRERMVVFRYDSSRGQSVPTSMLDGFNGCLQTDGYAGYNDIASRENITHIACMAHARRKFEVAMENDPQRANHALVEIQKLYAMERYFTEHEVSADQVKTLRQQDAIPILKGFKTWLEEQYPQVLPKSSIGKAIAYSLKLWPQLTTYTQNGEWLIDNNAVENKIRPLALGRKNYLFAGSHQAAQQAAMMYSLLATCKLNDIEPLEWLTKTLRKLPDTKINQIHQLLPLSNPSQL